MAPLDAPLAQPLRPRGEQMPRVLDVLQRQAGHPEARCRQRQPDEETGKRDRTQILQRLVPRLPVVALLRDEEHAVVARLVREQEQRDERQEVDGRRECHRRAERQHPIQPRQSPGGAHQRGGHAQQDAEDEREEDDPEVDRDSVADDVRHGVVPAVDVHDPEVEVQERRLRVVPEPAQPLPHSVAVARDRREQECEARREHHERRDT